MLSFTFSGAGVTLPSTLQPCRPCTAPVSKRKRNRYIRPSSLSASVPAAASASAPVPERWTRTAPREECTIRGRQRPFGSPSVRDLPKSDASADGVLSDDALAEIRTALKERHILNSVAASARCVTVRFTGLLYRRCTHNPDGVPNNLRAASQRPQLALVHVPPGIVQRTIWSTQSQSQSQVPRIIAVFERIGSNTRDDDIRAAALRTRDDDIEKQYAAWADRRQALRTETDLMHPEGPELYRESFYDMY